MAPFDAGYIQDDSFIAALGRDVSALLRTSANDVDSDVSQDGQSAEQAELEEALIAPALRKQTGIEGFLQSIDANGALTGLVFIGAYLALITAA
jgi:hypothetical protein